MLKILFITDHYPSKEIPQKCIFIEQQAQALISLGNKVDVLIPRRVENPMHGSTYHIYHNVKIWSLEYSLSVISKFIYQPIKEFEEDLKQIIMQNGYNIVSIHIARDVVKNVAVKVCAANNIKVVVHYHGLNVWGNYYTPHPFYDRYLANKRKKFLKKVDGVVGVSDLVCSTVNSKMPNIKTHRVYNGVDCSLFKPLENKKKDDDNIQITCVANLIPIKGHRYLIEAFKIICDRYASKNFILNIVGIGIEYDNLEKMVESLGLVNKVKFHGYQAYDSVARIMQNSNIFAMPSYFEALGCVYLEAMACKIPVIGCRNQGIEGIITDGETGMLVEPKDVCSLVDKLSILVENRSLRYSIEEAGYNLVKDKFTWHNSAVQLENVYNKILHSKNI